MKLFFGPKYTIAPHYPSPVRLMILQPGVKLAVRCVNRQPFALQLHSFFPYGLLGHFFCDREGVGNASGRRVLT